jgi:hypothetical protein
MQTLERCMTSQAAGRNPKKRKHYPNHRLVKKHRSYTVEEVATLCSVHKNTIRRWIKDGLPTCDKKRPTLIVGEILASFLQARRTKNKQTCRPGEIYCVRCRSPKTPAGDMADFDPVTSEIGNLVAICPDCSSLMNRRVNLSKLDQVRGRIDVSLPQALQRLIESNQSSVNSDLKEARNS